jgi:ribosomal protein S14
MKYLDIKNKKNFLLIKTKEHENFVAKIIAYNSNLKPIIRVSSYIKLHKEIASKKGSKVSVINRCIFSFYKKRLNKVVNVSRHLLLKFAREGLIYGLRRAVW